MYINYNRIQQIIPSSHKCPVHPNVQLHVKDPLLFKQTPELTQGLFVHSLTSVNNTQE